MSSPNPFDFSDFGPPQHPGAQPGPPSGPTPSGAAPGPAPGAGFDPWAGQPAPAGPPASPGAPTGDDGAFGSAPEFGFGSADGRDAFGQLATPTGGALTTAGPPLKWFAVALGLAVLGIVLGGVSALGGGVIWTAGPAWLLAGPIAIGALAVYSRVDTQRRTDAIYSAPGWVSTAYWVVLGACLVGIAIGAWQIALWAGKL